MRPGYDKHYYYLSNFLDNAKDNWYDEDNIDEGGEKIVWTLNAATLTSMKATTSKMVVKFFQPWCKACRDFHTEYKKAAKISKDLNLGIVFAQVNLRQHPELEKELGIETYPRILFWANGFPGDEGPKRYFKKYGLEANRLVNWLRSRIELASTLTIKGGITVPCDAMFQCDDGRCVPFEKVCDEYNDCRDGSDERFCASQEGRVSTVTTSSPNVRPTSSWFNPISPSDGRFDPSRPTNGGFYPEPTNGGFGPEPTNGGFMPNTPPSGWPDIWTPTAFTPTQKPFNPSDVYDWGCDFKCNDGTCQPNGKRCDGVLDCLDGMDETNCGVCKRTDFTCVSGLGNECIPYLQRCDGNLDCSDGSDEKSCAG